MRPEFNLLLSMHYTSVPGRLHHVIAVVKTTDAPKNGLVAQVGGTRRTKDRSPETRKLTVRYPLIALPSIAPMRMLAKRGLKTSLQRQRLGQRRAKSLTSKKPQC